MASHIVNSDYQRLDDALRKMCNLLEKGGNAASAGKKKKKKKKEAGKAEIEEHSDSDSSEDAAAYEAEKSKAKNAILKSLDQVENGPLNQKRAPPSIVLPAKALLPAELLYQDLDRVMKMETPGTDDELRESMCAFETAVRVPPPASREGPAHVAEESDEEDEEDEEEDSDDGKYNAIPHPSPVTHVPVDQPTEGLRRSERNASRAKVRYKEDDTLFWEHQGGTDKMMTTAELRELTKQAEAMDVEDDLEMY